MLRANSPRVLFVCLGNICRSPALAVMLEKLAPPGRIHVDSCALSNWNLGESMDMRMAKAIEARGFEPKGKAKIFVTDYFKTYDYIFVVSRELRDQVIQHARDKSEREKVYLATHFSEKYRGEDIPDPYKGSEDDFDLVAQMCEECCHGIIQELLK